MKKSKLNIDPASAAYVILHGISVTRPCLPIDKAMKLTHARMRRMGMKPIGTASA
ncbi:MAG: hypothetical protein JNM12_09990 [Alphaproteobacteria bacterium]|nr:hypothetical protein [Alphaproteobacteria bacterium]